jgi:pyrroloquinoline quinone biosynthesis protein B
MRVRVLGTAAGGGWPQWNCACNQCQTARRQGLERTQDCVAVSGNGSDWYLLNASPDLRAQILATPELSPRPPRETPIRGVLLTDAELDHTLGLFLLREAATLEVYATPTVLSALEDALPVRRIVDPYGKGWVWRPVKPGQAFTLLGLSVEVVKVGEKRPRYASGVDGDDWVAGYRIGDFLYAPCFGEWTSALDDALAGCRTALIDGTFLARDEMPGVKGHLPIEDSRPHLARHPGVRFLFTHLNNTNPLLSRPAGDPAVATELEPL